MKLTTINSIRTNNFSDDRVMQKITELWKNASNCLAKYENITYGVYHEYESDYKGDYSLSIGIEDNGEKPVIEIPDYEKYEIFKVDTGEEQGIFNTWSKIWDQEESGTLKRAYSYDYEKYYPNGEIEIHIAIK
ncbi:AraC family transcriptional regulator [Neobacillus novalis]|uniref:AraC family transcriptional regulator n=1 Tax=Neobacillus novalis TaxID=220687 RepID=A0AA95MR88_9BACI|nr:transcriptional regulator [Neobacillus novalis]WHY85821.1 AraC family transcriptional regulator [Neobacillus novalis]